MENIDIVNSKGEDMKCPTMLKTAGKKKKEPGYSGVQGAYNRAVRAGDKGIKKFRTHPVLKKKYRSTMIKNYIVQPAIGTAIGRILGGPGAGTALGFSGGILSGMIGQNIDRTKATRDWLQDRGMTHKSRQPRFAMTPEAKEKYLSKKYQGGGYGKGKTAMDEKKKPGYFARNMAASRAMRASDTGVKSVLAKKELIKARTKNMPVNFLVIPAASTAAGAGLGRLVKRTGAGAVVGATIGLGTGYFKNLIDMVRADKKYLKGKGMNMNQFTGNVKLSPEAAQKYLHKKYVGGGYGK